MSLIPVIRAVLAASNGHRDCASQEWPAGSWRVKSREPSTSRGALLPKLWQLRFAWLLKGQYWRYSGHCMNHMSLFESLQISSRNSLEPQWPHFFVPSGLSRSHPVQSLYPMQIYFILSLWIKLMHSSIFRWISVRIVERSLRMSSKSSACKWIVKSQLSRQTNLSSHLAWDEHPKLQLHPQSTQSQDFY